MWLRKTFPMTAYRNRRVSAAGALLACLAAGGLASAADNKPGAPSTSGWTTQVGEPLRLVPGPRNSDPRKQQRTAPDPKPPADRGVSRELSPADPPGRRGDISVESATLGEIDADSVGLLDADKGGLGTAMWRGTERRVVERLLPIVPGTLKSATLRKLAIRLLLSRASAPPGKSGEKSLLAIRVERLVALGDQSGAIALLQAGPPPAGNEVMNRAEVETRFNNNDNAGACTRVREASAAFTGAYWQKAMAYCLALSGEFERASMVSDILRESAEAEGDDLFYALLDTLGGEGGPTVDSLPNPTGLQVSMLRAANVKLPADVIDTERLALLRTAAFSPNAELDVRLQAAERLVVYRAVEPGEIADLYNSVPFTKDELADPLRFAKQSWGPRGRALLIRAVTLTSEPRAKAKLLKRAWVLAREQGGVETLLWASKPALMSLKPVDALIDEARDIAWGLFATGQHARGMEWFNLAVANSQANPRAARAVNTLWPVAQLADTKGEMIWDETQLDLWWNDLNKAQPKAARATATMVYSLLESLGKQVSGAAWSKLVGRPGARATQAPDAALWKALGDASENGRVGETVLYALIALGAGGEDARSPISVGAVVGALRKVGLEAEARGIALEAAIAAGA